MKKCTVCKEFKDVIMFNKDRTRHDGLHATCKECCKIRRARHYSENKEEILASNKEWKIENKEHYRESERIREKNRIKSDPVFKLKKMIRSRLRDAIKDNFKTGSAVSDLGCTVEYLKTYIESKFKPNMSWENHGEWELDHIIPLAKFDLLNREEFLKACNYSNLQPLWKKDHIAKTKLDIYGKVA